MRTTINLKDGMKHYFTNVRNTYVQNGSLLVVEFEQLTDGEKRIDEKFPLSDVYSIQDGTADNVGDTNDYQSPTQTLGN